MSDTTSRRRPLRRLLPLLIGLGVAMLLQQFLGAHEVELLVSIPAASDTGAGATVRVTRASDSKLVVQIQETARASQAHTVVVRTKLPRGRYRADVWLEDERHTALVGEFQYRGEDLIEVPVALRSGH